MAGRDQIVAMFEVYYKSGFPSMWWVMLTTPFNVYVCVSGWGIYRYRETRSLTIAQFLGNALQSLACAWPPESSPGPPACSPSASSRW